MVDTQDEFYEWFDKCPVQWILYSEHDGIVTYSFILPDTNLEDLED